MSITKICLTLIGIKGIFEIPLLNKIQKKTFITMYDFDLNMTLISRRKNYFDLMNKHCLDIFN